MVNIIIDGIAHSYQDEDDDGVDVQVRVRHVAGKQPPQQAVHAHQATGAAPHPDPCQASTLYLPYLTVVNMRQI